MTDAAMTADGRVRVLADGNEMPMLGLGLQRLGVDHSMTCSTWTSAPRARASGTAIALTWRDVGPATASTIGAAPAIWHLVLDDAGIHRTRAATLDR